MSPSTYQRVELKDFICAKVDDGDVLLCLTNKEYRLKKKLIDFEEGMKEFGIVRISRDCLVSVEQIDKVTNGKIFFIDGKYPPVNLSRQYKSDLIDRVKTYMLAP